MFMCANFQSMSIQCTAVVHGLYNVKMKGHLFSDENQKQPTTNYGFFREP